MASKCWPASCLCRSETLRVNCVPCKELMPPATREFLFGGAIKGNFHILPGKTDVVAVAEGYATAASIHEATGWTVLCAFNCGNLLPVARAWREKKS